MDFLGDDDEDEVDQFFPDLNDLILDDGSNSPISSSGSGNPFDDLFRNKKKGENKVSEINRTKKLDVSNYTTPQGQQKLVPDLIEKINELIMKVEMIEVKCNGQTKIMYELKQRLNSLEQSTLL